MRSSYPRLRGTPPRQPPFPGRDLVAPAMLRAALLLRRCTATRAVSAIERSLPCCTTPLPPVICSFCFILAAGGLRAAPSDNANPELHGWFESLKQPVSGISCCSIADCLPVDYKMEGDGYEALIEARWVRIPGDKILHGKPN